ncbi:hypothetical protein SLS62_007613 [Diatrype stigma]|uniref:Uncharacterized protein n=1 Tax=Diatrype stigma TaxID=117547 RepID=A0AAN9YQJ7_9PEZI
MRQRRAGRITAALCLASLLAGHQAAAAVLASGVVKTMPASVPALRRQDGTPSSCADLSTTAPNWQLTKAVSSDWPGGGSGRVQFFARHGPTGQLASCHVGYQLSEDGGVVDYDPAEAHACVNFGPADLNTTAQLDLDALRLTLRSSWACDDEEEGGVEKVAVHYYSATGSVDLDRDTSPGACLVEPTQIGDSTTCPIADVEVEGKLEEE